MHSTSTRRHGTLAQGVASIALTLALAACDREPTAQWAGTVARDGGAVVVHNPATPLLDSGAVTVERRWTAPVGEQGPEAGALWAAPVELRLGRDALYVLDRQEQRVHVVSPDGRWTHSVGRKGRGPGELARALALDVLSGAGDDTVVVLDNGRAALVLYAAEGRHLGDVRLPAMAFDVHAVRGLPFMLPTFDRGRGNWMRLALDGRSAPFLMPGSDTAGREPGCRRYTGAGERLLRLSCVVPVVEELDSTGTVHRRVAIAFDTVRSTAGELDSLRRRMEAFYARERVPTTDAKAVIDMQLASATVHRRFRDVRRDARSGAWAVLEQREEDLGGGPATVHLLSPEGVYLARLAMEHEWRDFAFRDGTLYALEVSPDDGLPRLVALAVGLPADALARAERAFRARDAAGSAGAGAGG